MHFLADADMTQLSGDDAAEVLIAMEQVDAAQATVRGKTVQVFNDKHVYAEFGHRATSAWLVHYTHVKIGKARQVAALAGVPELRMGSGLMKQAGSRVVVAGPSAISPVESSRGWPWKARSVTLMVRAPLSPP
jgi:hypothetical protein